MPKITDCALLRTALLSGLVINATVLGAAQEVNAENPELAEASLDLQAAQEAWQHSDEEYRKFINDEGVPEVEVLEFAAFVVELRLRVIRSIVEVSERGGDVSQYFDTPEKSAAGQMSQEDLASLNPEPIAKRELTHEEQVDELVKKLALVGKAFDEMLSENQPGAGGVPVNGQSNGGWAGGGVAGSESTGQTGAQQTGASGEKIENAEPGAGPGINKPDKTPDFDINNLGDGRDDDTVARQLRELAEHETDKAMKAELWKRYIKYKNR